MYKRILVKAPNWLGDAVMALPTIKGLRSLFPESHIAVLVKSDLQDLFLHEADVNEVIAYESKRNLKRLYIEYKMLRQIRRKGFDLAVIMPRSFHSALIGFLSKIPNRIGYSSDARSKLLTQTMPRTEAILKVHRVHYFMNLLNLWNKPIPFSSPRITIPKDIKKWADAELSHQKEHQVIGFNPGATYGSAKCWPAERFAQLGRELIEKKKAWIILFGAPAEGRLNAAIAAQINHPSVLNYTGRTSITQLAGLLSHCKCLVTNDTGTMHVAAAVRTPVVAIFGPTDHVTTPPFPIASGQVSNEHTLIRHEVECSPCLKRTCPTDHKCMNLVSVEEIYKACIKYL